MDCLDVNDVCEGLITNLKMHLCQWRNHKIHNPWK